MSQLIKKAQTACNIWKNEGMKVLEYKTLHKFLYSRKRQPEQDKYKRWIHKHEKQNYKRATFSYMPLISVVVPVYNVEESMLRACIDSVCKQSYPNWELCLADDASTMACVRECLGTYADNPQIKITYREKNGHISECTNTAIGMASGEFIAFMDCDDVLADNALEEVVRLLNKDKELDFIYSDEDKLSEDGKRRHQPHFKPDWSPDTMMSLMYTCHLGVYRKSIGDELGWLRKGFEGAQDYDFTLLFTEKTNRIGHIPKILYHWRERKESTASNPEAKDYVREVTKKAKEEALKRRGYTGELEWVSDIYQYRVNYRNEAMPLVSVIVPSKDNFDVYKRCMDSLRQKTAYKNYEIITVDNGSNEANRAKYEAYAKENAIQYLYEPMEFNFSRMCNIGVKHSKGEMILLLNDDMEILNGRWMERMVGHASLPYIGAVGAKLLYPNTTLIQHIGVLSFKGGPSHSFCQYDDKEVRYFCRNRIEYNYSAVTAACLMVSRKKYDEVNGLNEAFAVAYNDVDFCFSLCEKGYYNVARMDAVLYHHESLSRGSDVKDPQKYKRLKEERVRLYRAHPQFYGKDCFYNPNLTMERGDCSIAIDADNDIKENRSLFAGMHQGKEISDEKVSYYIERIQLDQAYFRINGWYVLKDFAWNNYIGTKILLVNEKESYAFSTKKLYREEMNQLAECTGKNNMSSFTATVAVNRIKPGTYMLFFEKAGKKICTGRTITIGNYEGD